MLKCFFTETCGLIKKIKGKQHIWQHNHVTTPLPAHTHCPALVLLRSTLLLDHWFPQLTAGTLINFFAAFHDCVRHRSTPSTKQALGAPATPGDKGFVLGPELFIPFTFWESVCLHLRSCKVFLQLLEHAACAVTFNSPPRKRVGSNSWRFALRLL